MAFSWCSITGLNLVALISLLSTQAEACAYQTPENNESLKKLCGEHDKHYITLAAAEAALQAIKINFTL